MIRIIVFLKFIFEIWNLFEFFVCPFNGQTCLLPGQRNLFVFFSQFFWLENNCFIISGQYYAILTRSALTSCRDQYGSCRKYLPSAAMVATNCVTRLGSLNDTLQSLLGALDQLGKVNEVIDELINSSSDYTTAAAAVRRIQRQAVVITVTTVEVITVVVQYQTLITARGKCVCQNC